MVTGTDLIALLPILVIAYAGVALMVITTFERINRAAFWLALGTFAAAFGSIFISRTYVPLSVTPLISLNNYTLYFDGLILLNGLMVTAFCRDNIPSQTTTRREPFYVLLLFAILGMLIVVSSGHFVSFFLGYEILSVSLYALIGYTRKNPASLEAAIKYLILAAVASAFLLFGIALIYSEFGTMEFAKLVPMFSVGGFSNVVYLGMALTIVGFGFKLSIVPFHMWTPDIYQAAPVPVTMLIASGSKAALFALLLRLVESAGLAHHVKAFVPVAVMSVATMFVGNLLALLQNNVKRLLAYSSIAQVGYMLIALAAGTLSRASSIAFYLVSYVFTTIVAFGTISELSHTGELHNAEYLPDYRGLYVRHPYLAAAFTLSLLSLTGIPLTSGFFAKLFVFSAAAESRLWWLLVLGVLNSGMSAFYYLRVIFTIYDTSDSTVVAGRAGLAGAIALGVSSFVVVLYGIYPIPLLRLGENAMRALGFQ